MQKKKTCGLKYTSLSKFLHRSAYFSLYTRSYRKKNPEKYSQPNCIFSGAKSCKTWRNMQVSGFCFKIFCFIEILPQTLFFMISKVPVLTQILKSIPYITHLFFRGQLLANFEEICSKKEDVLNLKCVYWNPTTKVIVSIVYLCEDLWCTEKYPLPKCIFSGAKSCEIWRELVEKRNFGLKCLYRNSCTEVVSFLLSSSYKFLTLPNLHRKKS